jgi:ABC-type uncharacterized transport system substrate-binding protein
MKKGIAALLLVFVMVLHGHFAEAQQSKKIPRIGYLSNSDSPRESVRSEIVRVALRELGYIEGQTIAIEYRYAEGNPNRYSELAAELVRLNVDMILVSGGSATVRAVMKATKTIPIVTTGGGYDPVKAGLIESLAHPGGNVTGLSNLAPELGGKRLELLKEAVPKLAHVAVLYDPATRSNVFELKEVLPVAARALRLTIQPRAVRDAADLEKVFAAIGKQRPDGLYGLQGPLMTLNVKRVADFALKSRLPSMWGNTRSAVDVGGLMSYNADLTDAYRQLAIYVDKILKGAKPADLPVEQPRKFELVINLKTAKQIGLTIPQSMLYRADRVIR